ncbi:MAG: hypothetical protein KJ674_00155 [Nanoarchaeota archaeon]|nr:hypothetical protein [Nanoarchaeota archaeon]
METTKFKQILKILLKEFTVKPTITYLAKEIKMSRVGIWKILKKMESQKFIILSSIGTGKTSTYTISLNWNNILIEKNLELGLVEESLKYVRWLDNFSELKEEVDFLIIYGSILYSKDANDIDILTVISNKNKFTKIEKIILKIQKTQIKKIHILNFTEIEFKDELLKPNKVFINAIKKGIILFGQERFIKFIKNI